jgi:hypothetical protein
MPKEMYRLPPITLLAVLVEFALIIVVTLNATAHFLDPDPNQKLHGYEQEWLTSSARFASYSLDRYGYLSLWQPYLSRGEPLIDNAFSFVLNPISSVPTLVYGGNVGIRYSVVLSALVAGFGGWALGRMMSFGTVGRVLLAILLAGKGNMIGMLGQGYFQLGTSQAYIPWVLAGTMGILRLKHRRFPIVLTAVMFTLMFWAGNIYFLLPTLMSMAGLTLTHVISIRRDGKQFVTEFDREALRRLTLAGALTLGLSAVTFIPIFAHQGYIGGHPNETGAGAFAELGNVIRMFFDGSRALYEQGINPGGQEFYHSFVLPLWFGALMFVLLPPIGRLLYRPSMPQAWKVWSVGIFMIVFCTLWGSGQNPVIEWMYANIPLIGQWRFVGRMLGIVTFWIAVLAALRVDALWRALILERAWARIPVLGRVEIGRIAAALLIIGVSWVAAAQVIGQWKEWAGPTEYGGYFEDECVEWLRQQYPDRYLSVWTLDYAEIETYLRNNVRHAQIAADFYVIGRPSTLFDGNLTRLVPEFGIPWADDHRAYLTENGFAPMEDSPTPYEPFNHCVWQKADAMPYAFTVPLSDLESQTETLPVELTTPVTNLVQYPDQIGLAVSGLRNEPLVVTIQEVAYPGWMVQIDGAGAPLESVGGLIGVVIPPGSGQHFIYFAYRPPLFFIGAAITLVTWVVCVLYLLRVDRLLPENWRRYALGWLGRAGRQAVGVLTSPELFEPRYLPDQETPLLPAPDPRKQGNGAVEPEPEEGVIVDEPD